MAIFIFSWLNNIPSCAMLSCFSYVLFFVTLWTVAFQAPLSMGFSRQEYWGFPFPPPGYLPYSGIESLTSLALAGGFFTTNATWEDPMYINTTYPQISG